MEFVIKPYHSAGQILLGMTREQVRNVIGGEVRSFKKTPYSSNLTDAFDYCHIYYNDQGVIEAIEFFEPANPTFKGSSIIGKSFNDVRSLFKKFDDSLELIDTGFTSYKFGIGVFAPFAMENEEELVEGVIVFVEGYYN